MFTVINIGWEYNSVKLFDSDMLTSYIVQQTSIYIKSEWCLHHYMHVARGPNEEEPLDFRIQR